MQHSRIYLIGFMGSGKSYAGRHLAPKLDFDFLDLDYLIEQRNKMSVSDIFARKGEETFRHLEREALEATAFLEQTVISCGGGTPCYFDNMSWINRHGLSVFIHTSPALIAQRLRRGQEKRPLIKGLSDDALKSFIADKLNERLPYYQQAMVEVHPTSDSDEVATWVVDSLPDITGH
jgi:shikimate kinase